jgi:two-component system sensor histidine kinase/response regulator
LLVFSLLWLGNQLLVMRPLAKLANTARRLGEGDLSARSDIAEAPAGFSGLAKSFDRMAELLGTLDTTRRVNRALRVLVAEKRVRIDDGSEQEMLEAFCRCIVEAGGYCGAWLGRAENDERGSITPVASAVFSLPDIASIGLTWHEGEYGNSAVARAIRFGRPTAITDMREAPGYGSWGALAREQGVASTIALPLFEAGRVTGALVIYAAETGAFDETETQLLGEVAADIVRALAARRERAARLQAELARDDAARQLLEAQRIAAIGSWECDIVANSLQGSDELMRIFEWGAGSASRPFEAMLATLHPEDRDRVEQLWRESLKTGKACSSTHRLCMPDGRVKYLQQHCQVALAADGTALRSWGTVQDITHLYEVQAALAERMKEIRCLYDVFRATEGNEQPLEQLLQSVVALLPAALQYPEKATARIRFDGRDHATPGFRETAWLITAPFNAAGRAGEVSVAYVEDVPVVAGRAFLHEEGDLLAAIAERVRETIERYQLLARMRDREAVFYAIVDQAKDAVALIDPETRCFVEFNTAAYRDLGYGREEFDGMRLEDIRDSQTPEEVGQDVVAIMQAGGATIETRHRRKDGEVRDVRTSARPIAVGGKTYLAAIWSDITEIKLAAAELRRTNRELRAIAQAMRAIVFAKDEVQLLHDLCSSIIESGGYRMAWVGYAQDDSQKTVKTMAQAGFGTDYAESIKVTWKDEPLGRGPTGLAIRECRPVLGRFIHTDPNFAPWRESALKHGYASSVALPILIENQRAGGAMMIYSAAPDAFDEEEFRHLAAMADALSFGIFALRERAARAAAQATLQSTAARLTHLLESSPVIVCSLRRSGDAFPPFEVSENLERLLGYTPAEALAGDWWATHVHPADRDRAKAESDALILAGTGGAHDYRFARKDGGYVWIRDQFRLVGSTADGTDEVIGAWTDVTAQKAAESEIRRLSDVVEQSPISIMITDLVAKIEFVNGAFVKLYGYTREEAVGQSPRLIHPENGTEEGFESISKTLIAEGAWRGEVEHVRKDRSLRIISQAIISLRDSEGKITNYVALGEDVTERRQNEDQLRQLYLAVEQSPESIVITDLAGRIEYVNQTFTRHSGYTRQEVLGKNSRLLQSGKTPPDAYVQMWGKLARGEPWEGEFINRRKDGSEYIEFVTVAPVRQPDGRITHYLAIKDDITTRKRMERELDEYRHHLEEVVASRTAELADARERADAANQAKSAFLANMSHEIRTPMNAITGTTFLLLQSATSNEQRTRLKRIEASSRHLLALIDDILDLSKIEAGKMVIEQVAFDLKAVLCDVVETAASRAHDKGLTVDSDFDANLPAFIRGDALRVRQILLNLGSNAVKFTETGGIIFHAHAESDRIRFEVRDTGIGLTGEQRQRLFQPFVQADTSTTRRYGGTGLGLAISRRLVSLMGGDIGVDSEHTVGSTFWFTLPFERVEGQFSTPPLPMPIAGELAVQGQGLGQVLNILVVEDDPINQEVASELLRSAGHSVDIADNGAIALERVADRHYDLVLMDMQMPVMDGLTATRALRLQPAYARTPVIAMTANAFAEDRAKCLAAGMNDFVAKPVDPGALYQCIARWMPTQAAAPDRSTATPSAKAAGLAQRLEKIGNLNVKAGLESVAGQWKTYERLLRMYCEHHAADAARMRTHLAAGETQDAARVAHTLKGVAAMMGMAAVSDVAREIDTALREPTPNPGAIESALARLATVNEELVADLGGALDAEKNRELGPAERQKARVLIAEMEGLLAEDDIRAAALFRDHAALLTDALGPVADEIGQRMARFDFAGALALMKATEAVSSADGSPA